MSSVTKDQIEYFFLTLNEYLSTGESPHISISKAVNEYAYVYYYDDGRSPLARASEVALGKLKEDNT